MGALVALILIVIVVVIGVVVLRLLVQALRSNPNASGSLLSAEQAAEDDDEIAARNHEHLYSWDPDGDDR